MFTWNQIPRKHLRVMKTYSKEAYIDRSLYYDTVDTLKPSRYTGYKVNPRKAGVIQKSMSWLFWEKEVIY